MDKITKNHIASIILQYYTKKKGFTQQKFSDIINVEHSSISKWIHMTTNISTSKYNDILNYLSKDIGNDSSGEFCNYAIAKLQELKFNKSKCQTILDKDTNITDRLMNLLENYATVVPQVQDSLETSSIISKLKALFHQYKDFITISELQSGQDDLRLTYKQWIFCSNDTQDPTLVTQQNYLILKFPNSYLVAIILTNSDFNDVLAIDESVRQLKDINKINLIIIITDNEIPFSLQKHLMETHNLFFETITKQDLSFTRLPPITYRDIYSQQNMKTQFYAQAIFERLTSYFNVIRNEIIFRTYMLNKSNNFVNSVPDKSDLLKGFVDKILLKDVLNYSYLSRHSIYFERNRLKKEIDKLLKKRRKKTLGIVMEMCYPNSFLSSAIYEKCDKLLLFTSSFHSLEFFRKCTDANSHKLFPNNLQFNMSHINPQYIANQYYEDIVGKVDLVILGFGMGSSITNITEYLRHINSWLSPNGIIFISFANSDSIILQKQFDIQNFLEISPLNFSDVWKYSAAHTLKFLTRINRYSTDEAKKLISTYVDDCNYCTYPFLSGLINTTDNNKLLMDEIRQIDKYNALKKKNKHGHYISVIGKKYGLSYSGDSTAEQRRIQLHRLIREYLDTSDIEYEIIEHAVTIDTRSLFKTLLEKGVDNNQFNLIKTVILQKNDYSNSLIYCVLPRDYKIEITNAYKLVPEKKIAKTFGKGSVSPLVILPNVVSSTKMHGSHCLLGFNFLTKDYVIFSSGISTESIKMKREAFIEIMKKVGFFTPDSSISIQ